MSSIAIIALARHGDLCAAALPLCKFWHDQGKEIHLFVHEDFRAIPDACSYITVHPMRGGHRDTAEAGQDARRKGFDNIIYIQSDGHSSKPPLCMMNFVLEAYARSGEIERFHDLPLIIDRRTDPTVAIRCIPPDDGRPLLLTCFHGCSDPYPYAKEQLEWVAKEFKDYRILDLSTGTLPSPVDLLHLYEIADCILTVDTLHLHLSHATETPVIALQGGATGISDTPGWGDSEPRGHWVYRCLHEESIKEGAREEIARILHEQDFAPGRLCRSMPEVPRLNDMIYHVADFWFGDKESSQRIVAARKTWREIQGNDPRYRIVNHVPQHGQRSSCDIGDPRGVPYVKDVLARGLKGAGDDDIVMLTNSDVCLIPTGANAIRRKLQRMECCYSRRLGVDEIGLKLTAEHLMQGGNRIMPDVEGIYPYAGIDLFAARAGWWRKYFDDLPDMFLGCEDWDRCIQAIMLNDEPNAEMNPPIIWHVRHDPFWHKPENINSNPAQLHNRRLGSSCCSREDLVPSLI